MIEKYAVCKMSSNNKEIDSGLSAGTIVESNDKLEDCKDIYDTKSASANSLNKVIYQCKKNTTISKN